MKWSSILWLACVTLLTGRVCAQTIATFDTSAGKIEVELFDDKPVTTANFIRYANSGAFNNMIVHRWEPNFVIQGGGYYVATNNGQKVIARIPRGSTITNEFSVGRQASNVFGTIAMARAGTQTNSATSEWFFNLKDNSSNLDTFAGGYTVFGETISGNEVLQRFIPSPGSQGIYQTRVGDDPALQTLPVLAPIPGYDDLIYVKLSFRRDFKPRVTLIRGGSRQIVFESIAGQTNIVEVTTNMPPVWKPLTNFVAEGTSSIVYNRAAAAPFEFYRVRADF